jgi:hypothetical protein
MTGGTQQLRAAITGLLGFAAAEEQALLAGLDAGETGSAANWAAAPLVAHNTEFRQQQVLRLEAMADGAMPPEFGEIDHGSADVYAGYAGQSAAEVAASSWRVTGALIGGVRAITDDDLLDPARNPWLHGRQLWLQIIVRGFWHPSGHVADYCLAHGQPDRAVDLAVRAAATAAGLGAPDPARGMASYNLACAQARAGRTDEAFAALTAAITQNPDVRANAERDSDLAALREAGPLTEVLSL